MILVFGGTTEGRLAVKTLEDGEHPYYYSTKRGEQMLEMLHGEYISGAMTKEDMQTFCMEKSIRLIVDAAHPFAELLHRTISIVARELSIPVVRLERIYPRRDMVNIVWATSYEELIGKVANSGVRRVLALTGVNTIAKLRSLWLDNDEVYFRILDKDVSRSIAQNEGFPSEKLLFYKSADEEEALMRRINPEAILTKESGFSGGYAEKVQAAKELGIRVFALERPKLDEAFIVVNGEHGLRREVEKIVPEFYKLHTGLTTGSCATAAAMAAVSILNGIPFNGSVDMKLPSGETISVEVQSARLIGENFAEAVVVKESGDDPDVTNHTDIVVSVERVLSKSDIHIKGGVGVGIVTIPGLGIPVGEAAINETPRRMIRENIENLYEEYGIPIDRRGVNIVVSVPEGEELAKRTFNPRLGVLGGISIIGSSGIIKPFSSEAFVASISKSIDVALAMGVSHIVVNSGAKSERLVKALYPDLPSQAFIHYGNFIGETVKMVYEKGGRHLTVGLMIGKAVKLAEGHLDTHSKKVTMNKLFIRELCMSAHCGEDVLRRVDGITLARELWDILPTEKVDDFITVLREHCHNVLSPLFVGGDLEVIIVGIGE